MNTLSGSTESLTNRAPKNLAHPEECASDHSGDSREVYFFSFTSQRRMRPHLFHSVVTTLPSLSKVAP